VRILCTCPLCEETLANTGWKSLPPVHRKCTVLKVCTKHTRKETNMRKEAIQFRKTSLPYCLQKQKDGSYLVLNRNYKPIGFPDPMTHIDYEAYPIKHHFLKLGEKTIQKLHHGEPREDGAIYLYNDGTVPTSSDENMEAYLKKLAILMRLEVY
jgi:hypothetical protein